MPGFPAYNILKYDKTLLCCWNMLLYFDSFVIVRHHQHLIPYRIWKLNYHFYPPSNIYTHPLVLLTTHRYLMWFYYLEHKINCRYHHQNQLNLHGCHQLYHLCDPNHLLYHQLVVLQQCPHQAEALEFMSEVQAV